MVRALGAIDAGKQWVALGIPNHAHLCETVEMGSISAMVASESIICGKGI